jgi:hypothetical protein
MNTDSRSEIRDPQIEYRTRLLARGKLAEQNCEFQISSFAFCGLSVLISVPLWRKQLRLQEAMGTEKKKREPAPTWLSTQMRPPWASTMCRAMESPSPVPPTSRERAASTR